MKFLLAPVFALVLSVASADGPTFSFATRGTYFPASRETAFPYVSCGVTNLEVKLSRCHVNNLNAYRLGSADMKSRMAKVAERHLELTPPFGEKTGRMLRLADVTGRLQPGFYCLEADTGLSVKMGSSWWSWRRAVKDEIIFALTDLGLAVLSSPSRERPRAVVLVHSFKDGAPVAGAKVQVLTRANQIVGSAVTDAAGKAEIDLISAFKPDEDAISGVMAAKGDDFSYLSLDDYSSLQMRDEGGQAELQDVRAFLFAERDICRPGESFDAGLFLRSSPQGGMRVLDRAPVDLELWDPAENRVESRRIVTDRWGFAASCWAIPDAARVGCWEVVARLGGREIGRFPVTVAAYVPDRFRVVLGVAGGGVAVTNCPPSFKGSAVYYFGDTVKTGDWRLEVTASPAPAAEHWKGWTVGTGRIPEFSAWVEEGTVENGTFAGVLPQDRYETFLVSESPVLLTAEASVTPPGARTVSAQARVRLDPTDRYVGVREGSAQERGARAFEFTFLGASNAVPAVVAGERIDVRIVRKEWKCHVVENRGQYRTEWREERTELPALARTVSPSSGHVATLVYPADALASGCYLLMATCGRLRTELEFWHWSGEVSERSVSPAALHLESNVRIAKPGEKVTLSFKSSREGHAYFVSGERGIELSDTFPVSRGVNRFEVPIRRDAVAKYVYVGVTVVNADAPDARRLFGLAKIPVDHAGRRYPLELSVPETARPGSTVEVRLRSDGAGAVRLMAVDEGVLALTGYETPDAYGYFYDSDFGVPFDVNDAYSLVYPDFKVLPDGRIGGGAAVAAMRRKSVRTRRDSTLKQRETARVVLPLVEIPASGETTVRMKMPDFTGAMRLMAVAVDADRAGSAERTVVVRDAASLFLNVPRCAVGGDRFKLVAEVFNHDLPENDWSLVVDGRTFAGRLAKGMSTNLVLETVLPGTAFGTIGFRGTLRLSGETFRDEAFVSVRPRRPPVTQIVYSVLRPGEKEMRSAIPVSEEWERLDEDRTETSDAPRQAISAALGWLESYPYGCLEQTTAAAFPFLAANDLQKLGLLNAAAASNAAAKVRAAYGRIMQMSVGDGSFAMWPGGDDTWTDGSLFALHFIFEAERLGLVKPSSRERMVAWLRRQADGNDPKTRLKRAYATYVLALAGNDRFADGAKNLLAGGNSDYASFLASAALIRGGHLADGLVDFRKAVVERVWETSALPESDCWSRIRLQGMTLAIVAQASSAGRPDGDLASQAAPLVVKLVEGLRTDASAWGTTRDNAWAVYGLAAFCAAKPSDCRFVSRIRSGIPKFLPVATNAIHVERRLPARVRRGALVEVEVVLRPNRPVRHAVLCDLIPGGFELEDGALRTRAGERVKNPGRSEIRDDRWLWFGSLPKTTDDKPFVLRYRLRAVSCGTFAVPAVTVEDMYDPDFCGTQDAGTTVTVEEPAGNVL